VGLFLSPAPLVPAFTGSAVEKGVINLDQSGKLGIGITGTHGIADFMLHRSSAFNPDIKLARQGQSRMPPFISAQQINGPKQLDKRRSGFMHDSSRGKRSLVLALGTLIQASSLNMIRRAATATRATVTVRPPHRKQALLAGFFLSKSTLKSNQIHLGIRLTGHGYSSISMNFLNFSHSLS
jgi:hypothetical protein